MQNSGYLFPQDIRLKEKKNQKGDPNDRYEPSHYPGFQPGKRLVAEGRYDLIYKITLQADQEFAVFKENVKRFLKES